VLGRQVKKPLWEISSWVREVRSSEEAGGLTQVRVVKLGARGNLP
jgi:hypothetical protein